MLPVRINRDEPVIAVEIEECDLIVSLQDLERKSAGVMPRNPTQDAQTLRIDCRGQIVLQCRFTCRGQRQLESRKIFPYIANGSRLTRPLPITAQIRMAVGHSGCC